MRKAGAEVRKERVEGKKAFLEGIMTTLSKATNAANGFNILSRLSMLWTVRHRCQKLSRSTFNCYQHKVYASCVAGLGRRRSPS